MKQKTKFKQTELGMIPKEFSLKKIGTGANVFSGFAFKSQDMTDEEGIPVIKIKNIHDREVTLEASQFLPEELVNKKLDKFFLEDRDVLIAMTGQGSVGRVGQIRLNGEKALLNQRVGKFIADKKNLDRDYLYFVISSPMYEQILFNTGSGSGQPNLSPNQILSVGIPLPRIEIQMKISEILRSLNDKIYLNRQINKTLEAIGQAIFKHWFVDFEFPNEKGKPYKSLGGEIVDSELGEIPKGWRVGKLGDCGTFKNGINYLRNETGDADFFIANVRDIANNKLLLKESLDKIKIDFKKAKEYLLNDKDILIARSASPGEISLVLGNLEKVIYSGFSIRYRLNVPTNYLYLFLVMQELKENLLNFSVGTTLQSVNQETLKNMKFILPSDDILKKFNKIIEHILDKTYNNLIQNRDLSQIRDSLLPKLMSGKIRVNKAETI